MMQCVSFGRQNILRSKWRNRLSKFYLEDSMIFNRSVGFHFKRGQFFKTGAQVVLVFALLISLVASAVNVRQTHASGSLTIAPITWNVIGLDSNLVTVGPEHFPIGARVCSPLV